MNDISKKIPARDLFYYRARQRNNIYHQVLERFVDLAEREGLTKKEIATALGKDQGWVSRQFSGPANWTLDTISDLLLALDAEFYCCVMPLNNNIDRSTDVKVTEGEAVTNTVGIIEFAAH